MALSFNFPLLRRLFLLGAVLMLASGALKGAAMTSETINLLYDYYKAAGSRLQMEKVNTLKVSGKVIAFVKDQEGKEQEVNQEFELWLAKPFLVRFNIRNEGSELSRGWDGYYSWIMMPTPDGGRVVQEAPRETHEGLLYLAGLFDNFYSLELKGYAFSKGKDESFDGKTYTMLRFTQDKQG